VSDENEYATYDDPSNEESSALPFFDDVETTKWRWPNGSFFEIERSDRGWYVHGQFTHTDENGAITHVKFCDTDGEDFYCADSDELLDLLVKYNLHRTLTGKMRRGLI